MTRAPTDATVDPQTPVGSTATGVARAPGEIEGGVSRSPEATLWERLRADFEFVQCEPRETMRASLLAFTAHPDAFERMFENAAPQLDYVTRRLAEANIPAEFALLPMVESRYLIFPRRAGSRGPAGPWQLMPRTARAFGLKVERGYDARLDLIASTDAAVRLLRSLHDQFDDWVLVNLAFNAGDGRVRGAIRRAGGWHGDAYALSLSPITRAHFSRLRALVCICADPQRYGLALPSSPSVRLDALPIGKTRNVAEIARVLGVPLAELRSHNPALAKSAKSPRAMQALLVPRRMDVMDARSAARGTAVEDAQGAANDVGQPPTPATHVVASGESLWIVARRYRVALENLRHWNALNAKALLRPGQVLRLTAP